MRAPLGMNKHVWHKEVVPEKAIPPDSNAEVDPQFLNPTQEEVSAPIVYSDPGNLQSIPIPGPKVGSDPARDNIQFTSVTNEGLWDIPNQAASRGSSESASVSGQQQIKPGAPFVANASNLDNLMADIDWVSRRCL